MCEVRIAPKGYQMDIKQLILVGTCRYSTNCFEEAVLMIDRQMVDVESLVSHTYQFEDSEEAFTTVKNYVDREGKKAMKVVILHDDHGKDAAQPPITAK
jgi:threonine dehydrogenase-like Zn-dependent dehydrogenase